MGNHTVYIVALWLNNKGSVTALCQEKVDNKSFIGMSTSKPYTINSCVHPFSPEQCAALLNITVEDLFGTNAKNPLKVHIDASTVFKRTLRIQTLEAWGKENAIAMGILNGREESEKFYRKKNKVTRDEEIFNNQYIYRKTRLAAADTKDVIIDYEALIQNYEKPSQNQSSNSFTSFNAEDELLF
jgi:hypothetical protein